MDRLLESIPEWEPDPDLHDDPDEDRALLIRNRSLWPEWHKQASCLGEEEGFIAGTRPSKVTTDVFKMCSNCPVRDECLAAAVLNREEYGVWSCTTRKERLPVIRRLTSGEMTDEEALRELMEIRDERAAKYRD